MDSSVVTTERVDFSTELTKDHESEAVLITLLNKMKSQKVKTHDFKYAVQRFAPTKSTVVTGAAAGSSVDAIITIVLTAAEAVYFLPEDVIEIQPHVDDATYTWQLRVVTSDGSATITARPYNHTLYSGVVSVGDTVQIISSAMGEKSDGRDSRQTVPTVNTQYCLSQEDYYDVTRIVDVDDQYTGPERARLREECRIKHLMDAERAGFFLKKAADPYTTGSYRYQPDGLYALLGDNLLEYSTALTDDKLYDFMLKIHNPAYSGGMKRIVLSSGQLLGWINKIASPKIRITPRDSTWGPQISEVQFAGKVWSFVEAPVLSAMRPGEGIVIQPMFLKKRVHTPTVYEQNVQTRIAKYYKDGFYSVWAPQYTLVETGGTIRP
jgi:hypothetical protein